MRRLLLKRETLIHEKHQREHPKDDDGQHESHYGSEYVIRKDPTNQLFTRRNPQKLNIRH